mgnify:CR=1 FL=1
MILNIDKEVARMRQMTVSQLREKYAEVFREPTNARNKQWLIKRIAWRMQANDEGDLSERARFRAMELANDSDIRMTPPREPKRRPEPPERTVTREVKLPIATELLPGMKLNRIYKGRCISVTVRVNGFEFEGERYASLTAVAKAATGKHWNGFHFFGLRRREAGGSRPKVGGRSEAGGRPEARGRSS